ncbi:MAG TPA: tetratricopeptide repeat protein [Panacibacter sp.]|nr:tetratricopeptide repeat protein [Panacibacter sp.]
MREEQYHTIEQYVSNELTGDALAAFEKELLQDAELAEAVQIFKVLNNDMPGILKNKTGGEALKKKLQQVSVPHFKNAAAPVIKLNRNKWYKLTAVAAMFIAIAGIVFWQFSKNNKADLYAAYIGHETISLTSRGTTNQQDLAKATGYYNSDQYAAVIPLLTQALKQDSANAQFKLILSRCYIETNKYENAQALLNAVASGVSAYKYDAVWLTAMLYLKQHKNTECVNVLQTIPQGEDLYVKAQELITAINKE